MDVFRRSSAPAPWYDGARYTLMSESVPKRRQDGRQTKARKGRPLSLWRRILVDARTAILAVGLFLA